MPNSLFFDRRSRSHLTADQGQTVLAPGSDKSGSIGYVVPGAENVADDASSILSQFKAVYELGRPSMAQAISADASVQEELVVPTGKYWRLIGTTLFYTNAVSAETRIPIVTVEQTDDTALTTITWASMGTGDVVEHQAIFGTDGNVGGTVGIAAEGRLTLTDQVTAGDTMTIDTTVYTFIADGAEATVANSISIGANEAAMKVNIQNELVDGNHPTVNAPANFTGGGANDNLDLFARNKGLVAGTAIALTETFTAGGNVFAAATLGDQTEGVEYADKLGDKDYPTNGALLLPTDKVVLNVTDGQADDAFEWNVWYLEFDNDPR